MSATSSIVAERKGAGQRAAAARLEPGDVPALLVDRDDGGGRHPQRRGQPPQLLRLLDVAGEQHDASEPVVELALEPGGRFVPAKPARMHPLARRSSEPLIPWSRRR